MTTCIPTFYTKTEMKYVFSVYYDGLYNKIYEEHIPNKIQNR